MPLWRQEILNENKRWVLLVNRQHCDCLLTFKFRITHKKMVVF